MNMGRGTISNLCDDHQNYPLITWEIKAFSDEQNLKIYYQHSLGETPKGYIYCEITNRI